MFEEFGISEIIIIVTLLYSVYRKYFTTSSYTDQLREKMEKSMKKESAKYSEEETQYFCCARV